MNRKRPAANAPDVLLNFSSNRTTRRIQNSHCLHRDLPLTRFLGLEILGARCHRMSTRSEMSCVHFQNVASLLHQCFTGCASVTTS